MADLFEKMPMILPGVVMGALIPLAVILVLALTPARKKVYFPMIFFGFATFFASLVLVGIALLLMAQSVFSVASVSPSDGDRVVMIGGTIVLLAFYLITELLRYFSYKSVLKKEEKYRYGGLLFGAGFVLAQDLLVLGIAATGEFSLAEALGFGVLMLICGLIYLLISEIGYHTAADGHPFAGSAIASVYFILLAVMLIFANMVVTYVFVGLALAFSLLMGYFLLPFKKQAKEERADG